MVRLTNNSFRTMPHYVTGIRAPRTARNSSEKSELFGQEAADFATRRYMQRDVEFEVDTVDKSGGFIGTLWLKNENVAISLVKEGLASVHPFSADGLSWSTQLYAAEVSTTWVLEFQVSMIPLFLGRS
jgi:staphylococcal nuclease domain-containing protein 1